ncbi:DUF3108 domain-containing protein [Aquabacterium sp.]|uniref:DUF3108 domain-containing protein n=1 Tax=Aquabacterium sp. TaxID=1872578 RepID=UPI0024882842|nr:DUF3108 domain-containing protein [Aquabacterium sp.]MDI1258732.1 DUF3108 domain-containing protein [Aquabacterium sp.]
MLQSGSRRWWLLLIILGVMGLHAWLTWSMASLLTDMQPSDTSGIKPMEATAMSELKLSDPPVAAPAPAKPRASPKASRKRQPKPPAPTASAPEPAPPPPDEGASASETAEAAVAVAEASSAPEPTASEPMPVVSSASAPSTPTGPPFVWPLATRVSYKVRGYFRGDVHGNAKVEWVRQGMDYQVRVDTTIGPSFAPIGSWNLISAGTITPEGLSPKRFEQVNRLLIKTSPPRTVVFNDQDVVLDSGEKLQRIPGMQDAASQFIQLSYQFIMQPDLLRPGNTIYIPLALPKRLEIIAYDVIGEEMLDTPIGKVPTFHVKPRKMSTEGGVLPVEIWFAPGLQYLPVRIMVRANDKSYMDLQMERAPEQAPELLGQ